MFDLDHEVAAWSATVHAGRCQPSASLAELSDHLYCEIDRARAEGHTDQEAFRIATTRLGSTPELNAEYAKNRSALGTVCQIAAKLDGPMPAGPEHRRLLLGHAVIWATLMIASSLVLKETGASQASVLLLTVIFIPLWQASDPLLRRALRRRPAS